MDSTSEIDYYERLQISANAEPEQFIASTGCSRRDSIPTTPRTGDEGRFRAIAEAYQTLSDPEKRAQYDIVYQRQRQQRWRLVSHSGRADNDFEAERVVRLTILEVLYTRRRTEPYEPGLPQHDLEEITGKPREHLEFTIWFLLQKKFISRADNMNVTITRRRRGVHRGELPRHGRDPSAAGGTAVTWFSDRASDAATRASRSSSRA